MESGIGIYKSSQSLQGIITDNSIGCKKEPNKCHAKCLIPDQYEDASIEYPIYIGQHPETIDTKTIHQSWAGKLFIVEYMTDTSQSDE